MEGREAPSGRWSAVCPEESCRPIGPAECKQHALALLGPFRFKTREEADRYDCRQGIPISEELATDSVERLARQFNRIEQLDKGAPRPKRVIENFEKLERLSSELAQFLDSTDDITRHLLKTAGTGIGTYRKMNPHPSEAEANIDGLPDPMEDVGTSAWAKSLRALSLYANSTRGLFLIRNGISDPDVPDKGGNTNLFKRTYGSARWGLVQEGWHLHEMFKPGEAAGTEGGSFHLFLQHIFEYATGLDPEQHSKLTQFLKTACRANREMKALRKRENELLNELNMLRPSLANEQREIDIYIEYQEISAKVAELWPQVYPYQASR